MGRALTMETDIDTLKVQVSGILSAIKTIEKELTGLSKLQGIVDDANKNKTKPKSKTSKKGGN